MIRILFGTLFLVFTYICMYKTGLQYGRSKRKSSNNWLIIGTICLMTGLFFSHYGSCRLTMRRRLNEPIISDAQLYGYEILDIYSYYDTSEGMKYLINIKSTIPSSYKGVLKNVEVLEKFYAKKTHLFIVTEPNIPLKN